MLGQILISLRDLQWRRRRFTIAAFGTALVFSLTLLMAAVLQGMTGEVHEVVDDLGAERIAFPVGATSPFYGLSPFPSSDVKRIAAATGGKAAPAMFIRQAVQIEDRSDLTDLYLIGHAVKGPGRPHVVEGRTARKSGELVVDKAAKVKLGDAVDILGKPFSIVGRTSGHTFASGNPMGYLLLSDLQKMYLKGAKLATMALISGGTPTAVLPDGFREFGPSQARSDLLRPLKAGIGSVQLMVALLWLVAAAIMGSVLYLSAIERTQDFAVFKATGTSTKALAVGLAVQAVVMALASSLLSIVLAILLRGAFPLEIHIPPSQMLLTPLVAVVVGLIASTVGLRRAVSVEPALAFGGR